MTSYSASTERPRIMRSSTFSPELSGERKPLAKQHVRKSQSFSMTCPSEERNVGFISDRSFYATACAMLPTVALSTNVFGQLDEDLMDGPSAIFQDDLNLLSYSRQDIISILSEDEAFQNLKRSLRQRGCVTNGYLKENIHFYVQHVKEVRARRSVQTSLRTIRGVQKARQQCDYQKHASVNAAA